MRFRTWTNRMAGGVWRVLCPPGDAQSIGQRNVQRVWHEQGAREGCLRLRVIHQGGLAIQQMYCMYVRYNTIQYNTHNKHMHLEQPSQSMSTSDGVGVGGRVTVVFSAAMLGLSH